jgi:hypothetical protein
MDNDAMRKLLIISIFPLLLFNCSNELDINTSQPYVPVVYCLLDLNAENQFVRVSRSYQPDELDPGKPPVVDSLIITEPCEVYIEKWIDDDPVKTWLFSQSSLPRDTGFFPVFGQEWYTAAFRPEPYTRYLLYVYFPEITRVVSAETITTGFPIPEDPQPELPRFITITRNRGYTLRWYSVDHAGIYQGIFTVNYMEYSGDNIEFQRVQWYLTNVIRDEPNYLVVQELNPNQFFNTLLKKIPVKPDVERELVGMEFSMAAGGEELGIAVRSHYINDFAPITDYTNLDNGIGLFSSLARTNVKNLAFSYLTEDAVCQDPELKILNFKRKGSHE